MLQGNRKSIALPPSSDQSRLSFQDSDGQGIWKEIHTDNQSTPRHSSRSLSFETGHLLTPSGSATSLDQYSGPLSEPLSGPLVQHSEPLMQHSAPLLTPNSLHHSPRPEYMEAPAVMMSPSSGGMLPASRMTMNSESNYYVTVPNTPQRNYNIPGRHTSPAATRTALAHSPQNINILSPNLTPLEKSPKLTQLHISSPRLTEQGGMTPMVEQLTLSPGQARRPAYDLNNMLPPASGYAGSDPRQVTMISSVHGSSTVRLKKLMKSRPELSPPPSVSKNRSPGRSWKKSFRAASPLARIRSETQNTAGGLNKDMNGSFQNFKGRRTAAACVDSSSLSSWRGCADGGQVVNAPALDREISLGWDLSRRILALLHSVYLHVLRLIICCSLHSSLAFEEPLND